MIAEDLRQIPMAQSLAATLARAADEARARGAGSVTLEHLLLALVTDPDAALVLQASNVDLGRIAGEVSGHLGRAAGMNEPGSQSAIAVAPDLKRVLEAAAAAAQQGRRREINGAIVLAAIVGDGRSTAARLLEAQGLTFEAAIKALQKAQTAARKPPAPPQTPRQPAPPEPPQGHAASEPVPVEPASVPSAVAPGFPAPPSQPASPPPHLADPAFEARSLPPVQPPAPTPVPHEAPAPMPPPRGDQGLASAGRDLEPHWESAGIPPPAPRPPASQPPSHQPPNRSPPGVEPWPAVDHPPREIYPQGGSRAPGETWAPAPGSHPGETPPLGAQPSGPSARRPPPMAGPGLPPAPRPHPGGRQPQPTQQPPPRPAGAQPAAPWHPPEPIAREALGTPRDVTGPPTLPGGGPNTERTGPPSGGRPASAAPAPSRNGGTRHGEPRADVVPDQDPDLHAGRVASSAGRPAERRRVAAGIHVGQLVENIPRRMRVLRPVVCEVRVAKADVKALAEGMQSAGPVQRHEIAVTKAMAVRLRAPEGGFVIEAMSPETQWIEPGQALTSAEYALWRWSVTPKTSGRRRLQVIVSARTVGPDGLAAETALPEQVIEVRVGVDYARALSRTLMWLCIAMAGGLIGKFGESLWDPALALAQRLMSGG